MKQKKSLVYLSIFMKKKPSRRNQVMTVTEYH